jgi:hypothetical protein
LESLISRSLRKQEKMLELRNEFESKAEEEAALIAKKPLDDSDLEYKIEDGEISEEEWSENSSQQFMHNTSIKTGQVLLKGLQESEENSFMTSIIKSRKNSVRGGRMIPFNKKQANPSWFLTPFGRPIKSKTARTFNN